MRLALERIAIIERYLAGEMDVKEKDNFESRLAGNPKLQEDLALQAELQEGIRRYAIKQSVTKTAKRYHLRKKLWQWGGGMLILLATTATFWQVQQNPEDRLFTPLFDLFQSEAMVESDADRYLEPQYFKLNLEEDTVIESKSGLVVALPEDAFVDDQGKVVKGAIQIELKEAIAAADILKAGLTTESNGELLESGGMYYLNATQHGKSLQVAEGKSIYVEVPTETIKADMQLFSGAITKNGKINWENPQPLASYLKAVDIHKLNFYPPNYFKALNKAGYNIEDKVLTDSIFYSFSCYEAEYEKWYQTPAPVRAQTSVFQLNEISRPPIVKQVGKVDIAKEAESTSAEAADSTVTATAEHCDRHLNPSDIKAVWNDQFQNTNLASKEFEERLPYIYWSCTKEVFDLYVHHLDWPLYKVDSIISTMDIEIDPFYTEHAQTTFKKFYARRDGKVDVSDQLAKKLGDYYVKKSKAYAKALKQTREKMDAKAQEWAKKARENENKQRSADGKRQQANFQEELVRNLKSAYRQLGYDTNAVVRNLNRPPVRRRYRTAIQRTGWYNVDKYVTDATSNRESMEFTDAESGKKAVIHYDSLRLKIREQEQYDRSYAYLISKQQYSFRRMRKTEDFFHEKLNRAFGYELLVVAYRGDQAYFNRMGKLQAGDTAISLAITSDDEINEIVRKISHRRASKDLLKDLAYIAFKRSFAKEKAKAKKLQQIHNKLYPIIFPCGERRYPLHAAERIISEIISE